MNLLLRVTSLLLITVQCGLTQADEIVLTQSEILGRVLDMNNDKTTIKLGCSSDIIKIIPIKNIKRIDFDTEKCVFDNEIKPQTYGSGLYPRQGACIGGFLVKFRGKSDTLKLVASELDIKKSIGFFRLSKKQTVTGPAKEIENIEILDCETFSQLNNPQLARWPVTFKATYER